MSDATRRTSCRRRPARTSCSSSRRSSRSSDQNLVTARSGEEALRSVLRARLRGHPARRQHAGHGRLRDGGADPPAQADRRTRRSSSSPRYADEMRISEGLLARRGRLHLTRRSCPRSCAPRSRCSSTCTAGRAGASAAPRSAWRWRRSARRARRPSARTRASPSWRRPAPRCRDRSSSMRRRRN